jgi:ferric-dicitrate binding protein FerR (iron transport regulator)
MQSSYSDKQIRAFAEWLNQPLTPGSERALNRWLSEDPSNQEIWESWQRINGRAKRLQVVPGDVNADWALLRDDLGFVSTGKHRKRTHSASRRRDFYKQPAVVAITSMIVYALFLYVLHMIRVKVGF